MRGYYVVHDLDKLQFGMTPHTNSTKQAIVAGTKRSSSVWPNFERYLKRIVSVSVSTITSYFLFKQLVESPWTYHPTEDYNDDDDAVSEIIDTSELDPNIDEEIQNFDPDDDVVIEPAFTENESQNTLAEDENSEKDFLSKESDV